MVSGKVLNKFQDDFAYYNFELSDTKSYQLLNVINEILQIVDGEVKSNRRILVHCHKGISRAPAIGIAYLIRHKQMYFEDAFDHVKKTIEKAEPNPGFLIQLASFDKIVEGSLISA